MSIFRRGEVWRLVTAGLVHGDWGHLLKNIFAQLYFGVPLEIRHGSLRIAAIYVAGVMIGMARESSNRP